MKVKIGISSNIFFYEKTIPVALKSYLDCGISAEDIYVTVGGSEEESSIVSKEGIKIDFIKPNAFDWGFLINLMYKKYDSDYWFITHDTAFAGKNFKNNLQKKAQEDNPYVSLNSSWTKGTGLLKSEYIFKERNVKFLENLEKMCFKLGDSKAIKEWILKNDIENFLFDANSYYFSNQSFKILKDDHIFKTDGVKRNLYFFPELDYYKSSSNYDGKPICTDL